MLNVITVHAHVYQIIKEIHTQVVDQSVSSVPTVQETKHVFETNVKIHVLALVDKTHNVM